MYKVIVKILENNNNQEITFNYKNFKLVKGKYYNLIYNFKDTVITLTFYKIPSKTLGIFYILLVNN